MVKMSSKTPKTIWLSDWISSTTSILHIISNNAERWDRLSLCGFLQMKKHINPYLPFWLMVNRNTTKGSVRENKNYNIILRFFGVLNINNGIPKNATIFIQNDVEWFSFFRNIFALSIYSLWSIRTGSSLRWMPWNYSCTIPK